MPVRDQQCCWRPGRICTGTEDLFHSNRFFLYIQPGQDNQHRPMIDSVLLSDIAYYRQYWPTLLLHRVRPQGKKTDGKMLSPASDYPVSYTHLTLPTKRIV